MRRILPAATATIVATVAAAVVFQNPLDSRLTGEDAGSSALFLSNIWFWSQSTDYLAEARNLSLFQQFWSLSLEEQFYILWPIVIGVVTWGVVRVARVTSTVRRWLFGCLLLLVAVSFVLSVRASVENPVAAFYLLHNRWWELGVGALLALAAHRVGPSFARWATPIALVGILGIVVPISLYDVTMRWPGYAATVPVFGTALVIAAGIQNDRLPVGKLVGCYPLQVIGRYSYSIYLWHWPLVVLIAEPRGYDPASSIAVTLLTAALAVASFHLIERPFRTSRLLQTSTNLSIAVGAVLVSVGVLASFTPAVFEPHLDTGRESGAEAHATGESIVPTEFVPSDLVPRLVDGTSENDPNAARNVDCDELGDCTSGDPNAAFRVVIFGDSHADHWAPALKSYAETKSGRFDRLTKGGCGTFKVEQKGCSAWLEARWMDIQAIHPDVLVLANRYQGDLEGAASMAEVVGQAPNGTRVVIFSETPDGPEIVPACLAENLENVRVCEHPWPNDTVGKVNSSLEQVAKQTGATFIDLTSILCTVDRCPSIAGNVLVYRDRNHLTTSFVESRTGDVIALLENG